MVVGDLICILLIKLEVCYVKVFVLMEWIFKCKCKVKDGYRVIYNCFVIVNDKVFLIDKLNILCLFEEGLCIGFLIYLDVM